MFSQTTNVLSAGPALCLSLVPVGPHRHLVAALVCGSNLPPGFTKQLFLDTGLIHVMVVSGAHLLFLEAFLSRAPLPVRLFVLGLYCWLTGFGPPVVKAFAHRLGECALKTRGWSSLWIEAAALLATLAIFPAWLVSRSLQMSWMCFLALALPPVLPWKSLDQSLKTFALLFIFVGASLIGVAWNTLVAPLVGVILFPISALTLPLPFLQALVDRVWDLFLWLLTWGPRAEPAAWFFSSQDLFWAPALLHVSLLIREVRCRRARAFSR